MIAVVGDGDGCQQDDHHQHEAEGLACSQQARPLPLSQALPGGIGSMGSFA